MTITSSRLSSSFFHSFIQISPLLPSVDVIWVPVYVKIFATAVFVILTSVPIITQHVIPNPEMKKLKSQCCDCCCCNPCCMGAEYTGRRKGEPKPVWSSSLWRSLVGGISVTFYLSIVQGLVSPLVCSSSGFLLIDADIVCWSGFHKTIAAGTVLSFFSRSDRCSTIMFYLLDFYNISCRVHVSASLLCSRIGCLWIVSRQRHN